MLLNIEIIGAIDGQQHYDLDTIQKLFLLETKTLMIGNDFVGRPGTKIHANETDVIKIRTELNFNKDKSRRWIQQALEKEQQIAVHHPDNRPCHHVLRQNLINLHQAYN